MKVIVVLSGGQDSTTCLYWALNQRGDVYALTINYGQRHAAELQAARIVVARAESDFGAIIPHEILQLGPVLRGTSPLVSGNALEQYKDHNSLPGGLEKTFVPMRNQLFLTLAANRAYVEGTNHLVTGVCQEDFGGYPDCRREFINELERTCSLGTFTGEPETLPRLSIHTPLMYLTKAESIKLALELPGCYAALAYSHTSYDGRYPPVGHDHATLLREKGFVEAGVPDPLVLRAWVEGRMTLPDTPNYEPEKVNEYLPLARLER